MTADLRLEMGVSLIELDPKNIAAPWKRAVVRSGRVPSPANMGAFDPHPALRAYLWRGGILLGVVPLSYLL